MTEAIGVLVMAYGGPNNLDEVEPYLLDVRGYRPTAPEIVHEVRERYRVIGGRSPILERTRAQAAALQAALDGAPAPKQAQVERGAPPEGHDDPTRSSTPNQSGAERRDPTHFSVVVGMRHWHPYIKESLAELERAGITRVVGLVMAPHYSRMSIGAYFRKVEEARSGVEVAPIERWHLLPGYLDALAARVRDALARFPAERRPDVTVLFTAHSLPQRILEWDDPYPTELAETVRALVERLGAQPHEFAYQSAAMTPEPWLGPDAGAVIERLAAEGRPDVLIAPVGFTTEHVEILYDVDHDFKQRAAALGVRLERIEMLNDAPEMIAGLAGLVRDAAEARGWLTGG